MASVNLFRRPQGNTRGLLTAILFVGMTLAVLVVTHVVPSHRERGRPEHFAMIVRDAASRHNLDPALIMAVIKKESSFRANARGEHGEYGLMQITPAAARDWGRRHKRRIGSHGMLFQPELNIEIGSWYLAQGMRDWKDHRDTEVLALAQYNAGPKRARKWARSGSKKNVLDRIPFPATRSYIRTVLDYRRGFRAKDIRSAQ